MNGGTRIRKSQDKATEPEIVALFSIETARLVKPANPEVVKWPKLSKADI